MCIPQKKKKSVNINNCKLEFNKRQQNYTENNNNHSYKCSYRKHPNQTNYMNLYLHIRQIDEIFLFISFSLFSHPAPWNLVFNLIFHLIWFHSNINCVYLQMIHMKRETVMIYVPCVLYESGNKTCYLVLSFQ